MQIIDILGIIQAKYLKNEEIKQMLFAKSRLGHDFAGLCQLLLCGSTCVFSSNVLMSQWQFSTKKASYLSQLHDSDSTADTHIHALGM